MLIKGGPLRSVPASARTAPLPERPGVPTTRLLWAWVRPLGGVGILAFLLWRLGTGPFLDGLHLIDRWALAAALAIGALTTVCCAWRWSLVAGGLGVRLPLRTAVGHCYRAIFLNATLPGGVLGDVHRAVRHGRDTGDVGRGIRAVVWERTAGLVVTVALATMVLLAFPSPVRSYLPVAIALSLAGGLGAVLLVRALPRRGPARWARALRTAEADIRAGLIARGNWLGIVLATAGVLGGHLEGVAAWAFGAAGLTAAQGVATAVVYGALVLVASLPGAAVLVVRRIRVPAAIPPARLTKESNVRSTACRHGPDAGDGTAAIP
ncbi:MAG: dolichol-P-glucose synthetase-like protein [Actinobacteria bacterium 13_2_20CM_2_71_6]|nr:MAG: dolichol-P-glucose synthetase-like protein [Actinobacteria bacterium 13_2_20CM_2_71_6]